MKRLTATIGLVAVLGFVAAAFACTNCSTAQASIKQPVTVTVPTVMSLIVDSNYSSSVFEGGISYLPTWDINLDTPGTTYGANNCYVVPNWVGGNGMPLADFIKAAGGIGNLVKLTANDTSYPAILHANNQVQYWKDVTQNAAYVGSSIHKNARAKGNVICTTTLSVEKYTNCPNASFGVAVTTDNSSTSGFGELLFMDDYSYNGIPGTSSTGWVGFNTASTTTVGNYKPLLTSIAPGLFVDDTITQALWLRNSTPSPAGSPYSLVVTYTLGSGILSAP